MPTATGVLVTIFFVFPSALLALGMMLVGVRALMDAVWPVSYEHKPSPMPSDIPG